MADFVVDAIALERAAKQLIVAYYARTERADAFYSAFVKGQSLGGLVGALGVVLRDRGHEQDLKAFREIVHLRNTIAHNAPQYYTDDDDNPASYWRGKEGMPLTISDVEHARGEVWRLIALFAQLEQRDRQP